MLVGALEVDLHIPDSHSLKQKRAVIRPIIDGARNRHRVASAEVDHQDLWQRACLGFAAVGASPGHVGEVLDAVERFVWSFPEVEVLEVTRSWLSSDDDYPPDHGPPDFTPPLPAG